MYAPGRTGNLFEEMVERPVDPMNEREFGAVAEWHGWEIVGRRRSEQTKPRRNPLSPTFHTVCLTYAPHGLCRFLGSQGVVLL
jgi:hypothetical protein